MHRERVAKKRYDKTVIDVYPTQEPPPRPITNPPSIYQTNNRNQTTSETQMIISQDITPARQSKTK